MTASTMITAINESVNNICTTKTSVNLLTETSTTILISSLKPQAMTDSMILTKILALHATIEL